jgi:hypothetical protein
MAAAKETSTATLVQVHAGFVDLAAQVAPLVRRQAATAAAVVGLLVARLVARLVVLPDLRLRLGIRLLLLILLLATAQVIVAARVRIALATVLRQRKAFARLVLRRRVVAAVTTVLLGEGAAGTGDQRARQRTAKDSARDASRLRCCLVVGERAIHWCASSAMPV